MDLSRLKWPIIILVVGFVGWLFTAGGTAWMEGQVRSYVPGTSAEGDVRNEKMLTTLAGWYSKTFRYEKSIELRKEATERYPEGENFYLNYYRMARLHEALADATTNPDVNIPHYKAAMNILADCYAYDIHNTKDERVADKETCEHLWDAIAETSGLGTVGGIVDGKIQ